MINDLNIDLTIDAKFSRYTNNGVPRWEHFRNENITYAKLFKSNNIRLLPMDSWYRKLMLPWNLNSSKHCNVRIRKFKTDDWLSNLIGETVRSTSDNTWFKTNKISDLVIEDFCLEELGALPLTSTKFCLHCGRKTITTVKNKIRVGYCRKCSSNTIPWQNKPIFPPLELS